MAAAPHCTPSRYTEFVVSTASMVLSGTGARLSLNARCALLALLLVAEKFALNFFVDFDAAQQATGFGATVRIGQHFGFRFIAALVMSLALLAYAAADARWMQLNTAVRGTAIQPRWLTLHGLLLLPLAVISYFLYGARGATWPLPVLTALWLLCALVAVIALLRAMAPWVVWTEAARALGLLWIYAAGVALMAATAMQWSEQLWGSTAAVTFDAVRHVLAPIIPNLRSDPTTLVLATDRFAIQVSDVCSGLEGAGLLLVFCCVWLLCFRKEYIFPRALLLIPSGLALSFGLNVLRIAALMLIGHAGFADVAVYGFHSQAGWIAFNCAAGAVAIASRRSAWLNRSAAATATTATSDAHTENRTAVYLLPLLATLAASMMVHAASAGFEKWYGVKLAVAAATLVWSVPRLRGLNWRCSWRGPLAGVAVFALWIAAAALLTRPSGMPEQLVTMSVGARALWIAVRVIAAVITVPIAEELAYRGYLMRRLISADFEAVDFRQVGIIALLVSALAFGVMHGALWPAGIIAGIIYGAVLIRTGRLGEAVVAHATTNALLAGYVIAAQQWQLW
jgi:exosortase E/protease (VPEID-CTERM system)